ncbi:helix-turn-helix transcriptional regulator [Thalassotalea sp. 1_MG-2023]|uniref:helix-turn-helix transcriptional regulator n=1 Tax=Thalassotalea sp. 1_MG-2023 TaxID=3062680 RepID=UPI0034A4CA0C
MFTNSYILTLKELPNVLGISRTALWKLRSEGSFPAPLKLNGKILGWRRESITNWLDSLQKEAA